MLPPNATYQGESDLSSSRRLPRLLAIYQRYLSEQDSASFVRDVSAHYQESTLGRILSTGERDARRGAGLALGYLGTMSSNAALGRAMTDEDRGVRIAAENSLRQVWFRDGSPTERERLAELLRLNNSKQYQQAIDKAGRLITENPLLAEAWNQRAVSYYNLGQLEESIRDCHQALEFNPYHFAAAAGMGQCYIQLGDDRLALESFQRALRLNPGLEGIRACINYLQKSLDSE